MKRGVIISTSVMITGLIAFVVGLFVLLGKVEQAVTRERETFIGTVLSQEYREFHDSETGTGYEYWLVTLETDDENDLIAVHEDLWDDYPEGLIEGQAYYFTVSEVCAAPCRALIISPVLPR